MSNKEFKQFIREVTIKERALIGSRLKLTDNWKEIWNEQSGNIKTS